jgi:ABC-type transport system substrate-binding protein
LQRLVCATYTRVDEAIRRAQKRKDLYIEATRIIHEEKPWIELFQEVVIYGVSKRVTFKPRADFRLIAAEMTATR